MASKTTNASELTRLINQLRQERQQHEQAIAEIDATFKAFGIGLSGGRGTAGKAKGKKRGAAAAATPAKGRGKGRGRKGAGKKGGGRTPWSRKFPITGDELHPR